METELLVKNVSNSSAGFDKTETYRYWLSREFEIGTGVCNFVMLNPSTATHEVDDPTIRRCIGFAKSWGYGRLCVTNLFALRSTSPKNLYSHPDPIGPENEAIILEMAKASGLVICAWGLHGYHMGRGEKTIQMLKAVCSPHFLSLTKDGLPSHPLYLKAELKPKVFA